MSIALLTAVLNTFNPTEWIVPGPKGDRAFSLAHKIVLAKLADVADDEGRNVFPAIRTTAAVACCTERQAQRVMRDLEYVGLIRLEAKAVRYRPNVYALNVAVILKPKTDPRPLPSPTPLRGHRWRRSNAPIGSGVTPASPLPDSSEDTDTPGVTPTSPLSNEHDEAKVRPSGVTPVSSLDVIRGDTGVGSGVTQLCHPDPCTEIQEVPEQSSGPRSITGEAKVGREQRAASVRVGVSSLRRALRKHDGRPAMQPPANCYPFVVRLAHDVLDDEALHGASDGELVEALKRRCATASPAIPDYNRYVHGALASARHQQTLRAGATDGGAR